MADDEKKRPNEGLPLSEERVSDEGLQFYYSRERRLSKAADSVRALYEEPAARPKFSLLRPLLSSRPNAILFGTMAALVLITLVMSFTNFTNRGQDYYGNRISVSALRYDGAALITLKKNIRNAAAAYTGAMDITVSPAKTEGASPAFHRVTFSSQGTEEFRFSVPFEEQELLLEISPVVTEGVDLAGQGSLAFTVKTK
ncbi:MAG: hypothetical protein LBT39_09560 [Treponema sp.]|jgi:hypothetical protein|nr:hypothetical protein [Treponema sp.]